MRARSVALVVTAVALVAGMTGPAGASADDSDDSDDFVAGAPGLGDAYFPLYGNGGYDVRHYDLDLAYDPATDRLSGKAKIDARATQNLFRYNLDLQGLKVRSVVVDGRSATWARTNDHELVITPRHRLRSGKKFTTIVRYDGVPRTQVIPGFDIEAGFIHTDDGAVVAGQPEVAANWYPVNDHPLDKATYTTSMTVPAGLEVIGNGRLEERRTKRGRTTWTWEAKEPMASYLATASVGQYKLRTYKVDRVRFYDAVDPDLYHESSDPDDPTAPTFGQVIDKSFARQPEILDFLSDKFGLYPFSTAGGSVDDYDNLFFALENQTRTVYSKFFFFDTIGGDAVIVHENAHQWFGDSVSVARWKDIWLNEGFATYAEWLWSEREGLGTAQELFDFFYNETPPANPFWQVVVADPGVENLFEAQSYFRGAMTLHQLRRTVGDNAFFRILRASASRKAGGNGTTQEFIALAEKISGQQLDDLFRVWLFTPSRPVLDEAAAAAAVRGDARPRQAPAVAARELGRYDYRR